MNALIEARRGTLRRGALSMLVAALLAGCERGAGPDPRDGASAPERPGLHAMMTELQHRHANLWFAGDAENWPLAAHHVHELEELLEKIARYHPEYDGVAVAELLESTTIPAAAALDSAVRSSDAARFQSAFDGLTLRCNACHAAAERPFLVIQRPTRPPLDNLRFAPPSP
jgi:hypothetical protein